MESSNTNAKVGRVRRSWELTKSTFRVARLDKKLFLLPVIGFVVTVICMWVLFEIVMISTFGAAGLISGYHGNFHGRLVLLPFILLAILLLLSVFILSSLFSGAIVYGANVRFNGGTPTLMGSLKGSARRLGPLTQFAILSGSIGVVIQLLSERIPFAGKIVAWVGGAAWSIATMLSIPIIVLSDEPVGPIESVKQSSKLLKKIWGEGILVQFGIGFIAALSFFGYMVLVILASIGLGNAHLPHGVVGPLFLAAILGFLLLILLFSTLSNIMRTALYYYATTGKAPEMFNKQLLQDSMTVKKARRIFA